MGSDFIVDEAAGTITFTVTKTGSTNLSSSVSFTTVDGTEALIRVAENRATLRGVVTDLHMPNIDGFRFVRTLRHMLPGIPVLVASGRLDEPDLRELAALGVERVLHKPFTEERLIEALRGALHQKAT